MVLISPYATGPLGFERQRPTQRVTRSGLFACLGSLHWPG